MKAEEYLKNKQLPIYKVWGTQEIVFTKDALVAVKKAREEDLICDICNKKQKDKNYQNMKFVNPMCGDCWTKRINEEKDESEARVRLETARKTTEDLLGMVSYFLLGDDYNLRKFTLKEWNKFVDKKMKCFLLEGKK